MERHGDLRSAAPEDCRLLRQWSRRLPRKHYDRNGCHLPYGLGAHSLKSIRKACEVFQPTAILEIGFAMGRSAVMWLNLSQATLVSVDNSTREETIQAAVVLLEDYPSRFTFISADSKHVYDVIKGRRFDMIFVDGGHTEADVGSDIALGRALGIKKFVFDDWNPHWGPGVQPAVSKAGLRVTHLLGENIALAVAED
jgi:hypothetical protein